MANLEEYLQAILDKIADGTETTLPVPSWNHEKYLAAIYDALSSGGGGGSGGGDTMYVRFTNSGGTWSADYTIAQIAEAIDAGKIVLGICPNSEELVCCAKKASTYGNNYNISFSFAGYRNVANSDRLYVDRVLMKSENGTTTVSTYYVALTQ